MSALWRKQWDLYKTVPQQLLDRFPALHSIVVQILYNRGLTSEKEVNALLNGTLPTDNPFLMADVEKAVALIRQAIAQHLRIAVYGDYDVDGVTATAILVQTLRAQGGDVFPYIPDREEEGYGLHPEAIERLSNEGVRLLITVDCGIRSPREVGLARDHGMMVVITDHHQVGTELPPAEAVINPHRPDCPYPFKDLAGAGVAYKLAQALIRVNTQSPLRTTVTDLSERTLLDLVALGTVADMVPLLGENHALVRWGLEQLNTARRPGLAALMQVSGAKPGALTPSTLGYSLGPRLNAAGRIGNPLTAFDLLMAPDFSSALSLAQQLEELNNERREYTWQVQEQARTLALASTDWAAQEVLDTWDVWTGKLPAGGPPLLFAASPDFQVGIIGLAAGRLVEEFYRPAVVVEMGPEFSKGSARSVPGFPITEALDTMSDLLVRYGGHEAAAGFTVRTERIDELRDRLLLLAGERLAEVTLTPSLKLDAEVPLDMLSWDLYHALEQLAPFGYRNEEPLFKASRVRVVRAYTVGTDGRHLKLSVAGENGPVWDAIAFRQGDWFGRLTPYVSLAYQLQQNEWNGQVTLQLNVQDIQPVR